MIIRGTTSGAYTALQSTGLTPGDTNNVTPGPGVLESGQDTVFINSDEFSWTTKKRNAYKAFYEELQKSNVIKQVGTNSAYGDIFVGMTTFNDNDLNLSSIISSSKLAESIDSSYVTQSVWDNPTSEVSFTNLNPLVDYNNGYLTINDPATIAPGVGKNSTGIAVNRPLSALYAQRVIFDTQGVTLFFVTKTGPEGFQANYGQYSVRSRTSNGYPVFYYSANGFYTPGATKVDFLELPITQTGAGIYAAQAIRLPQEDPYTEVVRLNWYRLPLNATTVTDGVIVATKDVRYIGAPTPVMFDYCHLHNTEVDDIVTDFLKAAVNYANASSYYRSAILDYFEQNIGNIHTLTKVNKTYPFKTVTGKEAENYLKGKTITSVALSNYDYYRKNIWRPNSADTTKIASYAPFDPRIASSTGALVTNDPSNRLTFREQQYAAQNERRGDKYLANQVFPYSPYLLLRKERLWPASVQPGSVAISGYNQIYGNTGLTESWDELLTNSGLAPVNSQRKVFAPTFFRSVYGFPDTIGGYPGYGYMSGLQNSTDTLNVLFALLTLYREFGIDLNALP